ncbi:ABC transporter permease [Rhodoligotrophos defluvii]|uniref:ABC transporter permease n=1 Tax=Rhodoligotrophos defluvii TaxID=2561934 RepID=UPI0010C9A1C5|nr:ABC transporter permease [Rhodoligotrophos defluvii]
MVNPPVNGEALRAYARKEYWSVLALSFPALLLVSVVLFLPTGWLFALSFFDDAGQLSLVNYQRLVEQPSYLRVFQTTFLLSLAVTFFTVLIGYPLAYLLSQLPRRVANFCLLAVLLPFWTSLLVRTYAWLVLLQRNGLINTTLRDLGLTDEPLRLVHNFTGAAIGMTHIMVPFLVLPLYASMRAINPNYVKAAANLGAGPARSFWDVFVPLSLPGLLAGISLVFVLCLGFYVTPALLGGGKVIMIALRIDMNLRLYNSWGAASALGVVLLIATGLILYLANRLTRAGFGAGAFR